MYQLQANAPWMDFAQNNTALHYAAGYGRVEEAKLLLSLGASSAAKNETGKTPLDLVKCAQPLSRLTHTHAYTPIE
jgi:hypothetical protein